MLKQLKIQKRFFKSFLFKYPIELETSTRSSDFIFDCVHLSYHKCHKIDFKLDGPYIDSSDQIKDKKTTMNPVHKKDNTPFQYAVTDANIKTLYRQI